MRRILGRELSKMAAELNPIQALPGAIQTPFHSITANWLKLHKKEKQIGESLNRNAAFETSHDSRKSEAGFK